MVKISIGSVSHATMRPEDLIPAFVDCVQSIIDDLQTSAPRDFETCEETKREVARLTDTLADIESRIYRSDDDGGEERADYWDSDDANYDLETLFDLLNEYAPPYCYFGAHPGDGSDYGFWPAEDVEREVQDNDGLVVDDTSEVPSDYSGEVLHINDHGNATLYSAHNGELTEIWSIA